MRGGEASACRPPRQTREHKGLLCRRWQDLSVLACVVAIVVLASWPRLAAGVPRAYQHLPPLPTSFNELTGTEGPFNIKGHTEFHIHDTFVLPPPPSKSAVIRFSIFDESVLRVWARMHGSSTLSVLVYDKQTISHVFDCPKNDRECRLFGVLPYEGQHVQGNAHTRLVHVNSSSQHVKLEDRAPFEYEMVILYSDQAQAVSLEVSLMTVEQFQREMDQQKCADIARDKGHSHALPSVPPVNLVHAPQAVDRHSGIGKDQQQRKQHLNELREHNHFAFQSDWNDGHFVHIDGDEDHHVVGDEHVHNVDDENVAGAREANHATENTGNNHITAAEKKPKLIADFPISLTMREYADPQAVSSDGKNGSSFSFDKRNHGYWRLTASVDYNFVIGGTYGLVLHSLGALEGQTNFPFEDVMLLAGAPTSGVIAAVHESKNQIIIRANLSPGNYTLSLVHIADAELHSGDGKAVPCSCSRFAFNLHVDYISAHDNHGHRDASCDADTLPLSFNLPGMIDRQGKLRLLDSFRFDTDNMEQDVGFMVETGSLLRVVVSHPYLHLALTLQRQDEGATDALHVQHRAGGQAEAELEAQAYSRRMDVSKDEGLFAYVMPGNYTLVFTLDNSVLSTNSYCTTVRVAVEMAPHSAGSFEYFRRLQTCGFSTDAASKGARDRLPKLRIPTKVGQKGGFLYTPSMTYRYMWTTPKTKDYLHPAQERVLRERRVTLETTSLLHVETEIEFLYGDVNIRVARVPADHAEPLKKVHSQWVRQRTLQAGEWMTRFEDVRQTLDRKVLKLLLPAGRYSIALVTGPIQPLAGQHLLHHEGLGKKTKVRGCGLFTLHIRILPKPQLRVSSSAGATDLPCSFQQLPLDYLTELEELYRKANQLVGKDPDEPAVLHKATRFAVPLLHSFFGKHVGVAATTFKLGYPALLRVQAYHPEVNDLIEVRLRKGPPRGLTPAGDAPVVPSTVPDFPDVAEEMKKMKKEQKKIEEEEKEIEHPEDAHSAKVEKEVQKIVKELDIDVEDKPLLIDEDDPDADDDDKDHKRREEHEEYDEDEEEGEGSEEWGPVFLQIRAAARAKSRARALSKAREEPSAHEQAQEEEDHLNVHGGNTATPPDHIAEDEHVATPNELVTDELVGENADAPVDGHEVTAVPETHDAAHGKLVGADDGDEEDLARSRRERAELENAEEEYEKAASKVPKGEHAESDSVRAANKDLMARSDRVSRVTTSLLSSIDANQEYTLEVVYTVPNAGVRRVEPCLFYDLQIAVIPAPTMKMSVRSVGFSLPQLVVTQDPACSPKPDMMPFPLPAQHEFAKMYFYTNDSLPKPGCDTLKVISFVAVDKSCEFRATLRFDFQYLGLGLRLVRMGLTRHFKSYRSKIVAYAQPSYNMQQIKATLLAPGAYYLEVYELHSQLLPPLKADKDVQERLLRYDLEASWYSKQWVLPPVHYSRCHGSGIPMCPYTAHTFRDPNQKSLLDNTVVSTMEDISPMGEDTMHVHRYFTVKRHRSTHVLQVKVTQESVFRLYVSQSRLPFVHMNIAIEQPADGNAGEYSLDAKAMGASAMAKHFGGASGVAGRFAPGSYFFDLSWSARPVRTMALFRERHPGDCEQMLDMELVILPYSDFLKDMGYSSVHPCEKHDSATPADQPLGIGLPFTAQIHVPRYENFHAKYPFTVPHTGAVLSVQLRGEFAAGTLEAYVEGPLNTYQHSTVRARYLQDGAYISNTSLSEGKYVLHLQDPFNTITPALNNNDTNPFAQQQHGHRLCQHFELDVQLHIHHTVSTLSPFTPEVMQDLGDHPYNSHQNHLVERRQYHMEGEDKAAGAGMEDPHEHLYFCREQGVPLPGMVDKQHHSASVHVAQSQGRLFFSSEHFVTNPALPNGDVVMFDVVEPSYVRVFAQTRLPGYLIDLIVYRDDNRERESIVALSDDSNVGSTMRERTLHAYIQPQDSPYELLVKHAEGEEPQFNANSAEAMIQHHQSVHNLFQYTKEFGSEHLQHVERGCNEFGLLFMMEPVSQIMDQLKATCSSWVPDKNLPSVLPITREGVGHFDQYIITNIELEKGVRGDESGQPGVFRHRIVLNVTDALSEDVVHTKTKTSEDYSENHLTFVQAVIGYNFLVNDFHLTLRDFNENVLVKSYGAPYTVRDGDTTFAHTLEASVLPGLHYLDVEEDTSGNPHFLRMMELRHKMDEERRKKKEKEGEDHAAEAPFACYPLMFGIEAYSSVDSRRPYIESVTPMDGLNLDPMWDLQLVVKFSRPAQMAATTSVLHDLAFTAALWLEPLHVEGNPQGGPEFPTSPGLGDDAHATDGRNRILPSLMHFSPDDPSRLVAVWDHSQFANGRSYRLHIDTTKFHTNEGKPFAVWGGSASGRSVARVGAFRHVYHFGHPNAAAHPLHDVTKHITTVVDENRHDLGLTSPSMQIKDVSMRLACPSGFHAAGNQCVNDTKCTIDTCHGHGFCNDLNGYPRCECFPGFATIGDRFCSACDLPHHVFPNCIQEEELKDELQMSGHCLSSILPYSLNAPGLLSPQPVAEGAADGGPSMHLEDWYHVNLDLGLHMTTFTLQVTSVIRAYISSDEWVQLGLYTASDTPEPAPVLVQQASHRKPKEGGIFAVLSPGNYSLGFMYNQLTVDMTLARTACPQLHLELSIQPLAGVLAMPQAANYKNPDHTCGPHDVYPLIVNQHPLSMKSGETKEQHEAAVAAAEAAEKGENPENIPIIDIPEHGFQFNAEMLRASGARAKPFAPLYLYNARKATSVDDTSNVNAEDMTPKAGGTVLEFAFRVPNMLGHQAFIRAELQYDFLPGQLRMELTHHMHGNQTLPLHGSEAVQARGGMAPIMAWTSTKYADIAENVNAIRMPLPAGDYLLTVFEPLRQNASVTACAPYNFAMEVGFVGLPHSYEKQRQRKFKEHLGFDPQRQAIGAEEDAVESVDNFMGAVDDLYTSAEAMANQPAPGDDGPSVDTAVQTNPVALATRSHAVVRKEHLSREAMVPVAQEFLNDECQLRPLPTNLMVPGLMGVQGHRLHLNNRFRYDPTGQSHDMVFQVKPIKGLWVHGKQQHIDSSFLRLYLPYHTSAMHVVVTLLHVQKFEVEGHEDDDGSKASIPQYRAVPVTRIDTAEEDFMSVVLEPGDYILRLSFDVQYQEYATERERSESLERLACMGFRMELAIGPRVPFSVMDFAVTHSYFRDAKSHGRARPPTDEAQDTPAHILPNIPTCPQVPFIYMNPAMPIGTDHPLNVDKRRYRPRPFVFVRKFVRKHEHMKDSSGSVSGSVERWMPVLLPNSHDPSAPKGPTEEEPEDRPVVAVYPLEVRYRATVLEVELESDFIRGPIILELRRTAEVGSTVPDKSSSLVVYGKQQFANTQTLFARLSPGNYALTLRLMAHTSDMDMHENNPGLEHLLLPYEFDMKLRLLPGEDEVHACLKGDAGYQLLPHSLNTVRYLGTSTAKSTATVLFEGQTHFFARFVLPSVHLHERSPFAVHQFAVRDLRNSAGNNMTTVGSAGEVPGVYDDAGFIAQDEADHMQFHVYSLSLFRIHITTQSSSVEVTLKEFPCASANVHRWHMMDGLNKHCKPQVIFQRVDYETALVRFLGGGLYELSVKELHGGVKGQRACASYDMELAMEPVTSFHTYFPALTCPKALGHGSDHFPPHPPAFVTVPYHYSSKQLGEHLYVQQRAQEPRAEHMVFTVAHAFRFYAELDYEFLTGHLSMDLMLSNRVSVNIHHGVEDRNRHVIALDYLPAGKYVLTIREPHDGYMGWFCSHFAFTLEILPIHVQPGASFGFGPGGTGVSIYQDPLSLLSPLQRVITPYPTLPATLDTIGYLGTRQYLHLFGVYSLLHASTAWVGPSAALREDFKELQNGIEFSVFQTSVLRAYGQPHHDSMPFFVSMRLEEHPSSQQSSTNIEVHTEHSEPWNDINRAGWVLATLQPGRYVLFVDANRTHASQLHDKGHHGSRWFDWGLSYMLDFELAIQPLFSSEKDFDFDVNGAEMDQELHEKPTPLPKVELNNTQEHVFHFSSNTMRLCDLKDNKETARAVHNIPFTVTLRSVVFVDVSYDFLENHLVASMEGKERSGLLRRWSSIPHRNNNQLYVTVEPGTYMLEIVSYGALAATTTTRLSTHTLRQGSGSSGDDEDDEEEQKSSARHGCSRFYSLNIFVHAEELSRVPASLPSEHALPARKLDVEDNEGHDGSAPGISVMRRSGDCHVGGVLPTSVLLQQKLAEHDSPDILTKTVTGIHALVNHVYLYNSKASGSSGDDVVVTATPEVARLRGQGLPFSQPMSVTWQWINIPPLPSPRLLRVTGWVNTEQSRLRFTLFRHRNESIASVAEVQESTVDAKSQLFSVPASSAEFFLGVGSLAAAEDKNSCPYFNLDVSVAPVSALRWALTKVPASGEEDPKEPCPEVLPAETVDVSPDGHAHQDVPHASFRADTSGGMQRSIVFKVNRRSWIDASLLHPFLLGHYSLQLYRLTSQKLYVPSLLSTPQSVLTDARMVATQDLHAKEEAKQGSAADPAEAEEKADAHSMDGSYSTERAHRSSYSLTSFDYLVSVQGVLEKGQYKLHLAEKWGSLYAEHDKNVHEQPAERPLCLRFKWRLTVEPQDGDDEDEGGTGTGTGTGTSQVERPRLESVAAGGSDSGSASLSSDSSSSSSRPKRILHCLHGGHLNLRSGRCFCPKAYAGDECENCAPGYVGDGRRRCRKRQLKATPPPMIHSGKDQDPGCGLTTCGCSNFNFLTADRRDLATCKPLGHCHSRDTEHNIVKCDCPRRFAGTRCDRCARGYINYPFCDKKKDGSPLLAPQDMRCDPSAVKPCGEGRCDPLTHKCNCPKHKGGVFCDIDLEHKLRHTLPPIINAMGRSHHLKTPKGSQLYLVYGATAIAGALVVLGVTLHYRQRQKQRRRSSTNIDHLTQQGTGAEQYIYQDDGL